MPVHVPHPLPRQERGARVEALEVGAIDAERLPDSCPDRLLAGHRERHVDAVQRHPVELALPARPVPPHGRVAERAHVEVLAHREGRFPARHRDVREAPGQGWGIRAPGALAAAMASQVFVCAAGERDRRRAADADRAAAGRIFEGVVAGRPLQWQQLELRRAMANPSLEDAAGGADPLRSRGWTRGRRARVQPQRQGERCAGEQQLSSVHAGRPGMHRRECQV